ncbi:FG-GAP repeat domain-containing protein [Microbacterium sp.]|uniref:FG-GAP repeat domain-containing protein n=1 Tax=Microbacterium sp. TaxID=51671 RepID=UPI003A8D851B
MHSRGIPNARAFRSGRLTVVLIAIFATIFGTAVPAFATPASVAATSTPPAQATVGGPVQASLAGFSAGNIISDAVFTSKSTMTEAQIQSFFNSKVKTCLGGSDQFGPIVCLKDYRTTSVNRPADKYCSGYTGAANETAARIIYRVAQSCSINPQVLIVMLQKEQGLVTHTWPSAWRYDKALGQGCPDDAACNPAYVGFFYQIYGAARQMQMYMEGKYFTWYAPGHTWNILYHPNRACGSSPVYVANKATSALYYYTPYQPNAAALRAGYGTGDGCSSYGNRNFYNYFTDWFGSTQTIPPVAPTPPPPTPTLASLDRSDFVGAIDSKGVLWGYPFGQSVWGARKELATGLPTSGQLLSVGDLDGDGYRDLVVLDRTKSAAYLLRGNGTNRFSAKTALAGSWAGIVLATSAGDAKSEGVSGMYTTDAAGRLFLRAGDDRGGFRAPVQIGSGWGGYDQITGGVDLNNDGYPDVLARDRSGVLFFASGTGRGTLNAPVQIGTGWSGMTTFFSPGDFTGDNRADILAVSTDGQMSLYRGLGNGSVAYVEPVGAGWQTMVTMAGGGDSVTLPRVPIAGAGNVDGAGGADVLALTATGQALVYGGNGSGSWTKTTTVGRWGAKDRVVALGDFSGDGNRDIARIDSAGALLLLRGRASGGFDPAVRIGTSWGGFLQVIGGLDFDGDRNADVLAVAKNGGLWLYRGNGRGGWLTGVGQQVGQGWAPFSDVFYAGDLKTDGSSNLLARLPDGRLFAYPISRTGKWGTARQVGNGWQVMKNVLSPGDFDGDGHPDLLAVSTDGTMYLYPGDGKGSWKPRKQVGSSWQSMAQIR